MASTLGADGGGQCFTIGKRISAPRCAPTIDYSLKRFMARIPFFCLCPLNLSAQGIAFGGESEHGLHCLDLP